MMRRLLAALLLAALALVGVPATATAAGELGLSNNGTTWSATLPSPIFDPAFRWVPGDSETGTFYIRNQSPDSGLLDLTMLASQVTELIDSGDLTVSAQVDGGDWVGVTTAGPHALITDEPVPAGAVRRINVRVDFDPASTNPTQDQRLDLRFNVALTQDTSVAPPTNPGGDGDGDGNGNGGSDLPNTGSGVRLWMILVGGLSIALGVVVARRSSNEGKTR